MNGFEIITTGSTNTILSTYGTILNGHMTDDEDKSEFLQLIRRSDLKGIKIILFLNYKLNMIFRRGNTPLHFACWHHKLNIVKFFVIKGCEIEVRNCLRESGIIYGYMYKNEHTIKIFNRNNKKIKSGKEKLNLPMFILNDL